MRVAYRQLWILLILVHCKSLNVKRFGLSFKYESNVTLQTKETQSECDNCFTHWLNGNICCTSSLLESID